MGLERWWLVWVVLFVCYVCELLPGRDTPPAVLFWTCRSGFLFVRLFSISGGVGCAFLTALPFAWRRLCLCNWEDGAWMRRIDRRLAHVRFADVEMESRINALPFARTC